MKVRLLVVLFSGFCLYSTTSQAQSIPASASLSGGRSFGMDPLDSHHVALSGKVSVQGGAEITKDTVVVLDCGFGERARSNVDSRGHFMLMLSGGNSPDATRWGESQASAELTGCIVRAEAPGYQSSTLNLQGHESGVTDVGTITISPVMAGSGANATVSVSSLAAPDKAKKAFAKGRDQAKKGRWAAACDSFRKAIQVYPRYAIAWLELGRAQLHENNMNDAQQSFVSATTQDSRLLPAYVELAHLQAAQQQWREMASTTANMVQLAPESSAAFWFLDSAANYNSQNMQRAESSAQRGLRLDPTHRIPQLEYLYGLILGTKQNYSLAAEHIKSYLQLSPAGVDVSEARRRLAEFEKLASTSTVEAQR